MRVISLSGHALAARGHGAAAVRQATLSLLQVPRKKPDYVSDALTHLLERLIDKRLAEDLACLVYYSDSPRPRLRIDQNGRSRCQKTRQE